MVSQSETYITCHQVRSMCRIFKVTFFLNLRLRDAMLAFTLLPRDFTSIRAYKLSLQVTENFQGRTITLQATCIALQRIAYKE